MLIFLADMFTTRATAAMYFVIFKEQGETNW